MIRETGTLDSGSEGLQGQLRVMVMETIDWFA